MDFNPNNPIVKYCLQGMNMEEKNIPEEASRLFLQAWNEAGSDFEKFLAAYFLAQRQKNSPDKLHWTETALQLALAVNNETVKAAFPLLYAKLAKCYDELGDHANAKKYEERAAAYTHQPSDKGPFYHGTKADLKIGDLLTAGNLSNYKPDLTMNHVYFTALVNGAGLAAALANGDGRERVYIVEPTGSFEDDPNVTNKKFPGNPTRSYRTASPLKILGEARDWARLTPEEVEQWREKLARNEGEVIN